MRNFVPPTVTSTESTALPHPEAGVQVKNPIEIVGSNAVRLLLGGGGYAIIDLADLPKVAGYRWSRDRGYAQTAVKIGGRKINVRLHRLIMEPTDGRYIDHRDGDRGNCQRSNLRFCTRYENCLNRGANVLNRTGYKGVRQHKSGLYFVQIKQHGKTFRVGDYETAEQAARAYDFLARRFFGDFARLNFPEDGDKALIHSEDGNAPG